jgi:hypothetical protein
VKPETQSVELKQTPVTDPKTYRGLKDLIEPLACVIAASDDPLLAWAVVIGEMSAQVVSINVTAQTCLD